MVISLKNGGLRFSFFAILSIFVFHLSATERIDLSGEWNYILTNAPVEIPAEGRLSLPGTLDTNGVGIPVAESDNTSQLSRRVTYTGNAVYYRDVEIPGGWEGKSVELFLERTKPATVKIDGKKVSYSSLISVPQRHDLGEYLTPGRHRIEIVVNNGDSIPEVVRNNSHACTESTQTNWNGIIGRIELRSDNPFHIVRATPFPQPEDGMRRIDVVLSHRPDRGDVLRAEDNGGNSVDLALIPDTTGFTLFLPIGECQGRWSEWNPETDEVTVTLHSKDGDVCDEMRLTTGLRDFKSESGQFLVNGHPAFMRGTHDGCVFPDTAHVPMDYESWRRYFEIIRKYGLNHVRFHSWCPPEECFRAADDAGVYLQPELPIWGELDRDRKELMKFLYAELEGIIREYSHHPSFTMFALGNELWGDIDLMRGYLERANEINPYLLVTYGSNIYLGWKGHIDGEDFMVTCRVGGGEGFSTHARASFSYADADGSGILNSTYPNSGMNFSHAISLSPVPVIGHETGQYQFYPDFNEIEKYRGVLRPDNLKEFRRRAIEAGNGGKTDMFFKASGEWATRLYLADMEMSLRTPGMGGFQLLDLKDYPGQGTALVGILDSHMESKGFISPEEWRESCGRVTLLAEFPKFTFTGGETVGIPVKVANFSSENLEGTEIRWETPFSNGIAIMPGGEGLIDAGEINLSFPELKKPEKMSLRLTSSVATNSYDIWVYPQKCDLKDDAVIVTKDLESAINALEKGKRVMLAPDQTLVKDNSVGPLFITDYWNYRMFRTICDNLEKEPSPGTLGLLIDDTHPAFEYYPTDFHTDWQWYSIVSNSRPIVIDRMPKGYRPVIEVIDNVERNYRLALMMECNVGKGRLMILSVDIDKACDTPEGRWFLKSVRHYMASKKFKPELSLSPSQLRLLLTRATAERKIKEIRNESYDGKSNDL